VSLTQGLGILLLLGRLQGCQLSSLATLTGLAPLPFTFTIFGFVGPSPNAWPHAVVIAKILLPPRPDPIFRRLPVKQTLCQVTANIDNGLAKAHIRGNP
jgi:hypothetical protein